MSVCARTCLVLPCAASRSCWRPSPWRWNFPLSVELPRWPMYGPGQLRSGTYTACPQNTEMCRRGARNCFLAEWHIQPEHSFHPSTGTRGGMAEPWSSVVEARNSGGETSCAMTSGSQTLHLVRHLISTRLAGLGPIMAAGQEDLTIGFGLLRTRAATTAGFYPRVIITNLSVGSDVGQTFAGT